MLGGQFPELLLPKWSDSDSDKIAAGYFTHNFGLDPLRNFLQLVNAFSKVAPISITQNAQQKAREIRGLSS